VLPGYLEQARRILRDIDGRDDRAEPSDPRMTPRFERIRWFPLPGEALAQLRAVG